MTGIIQINCSSETKHDGITVTLEGTVNLQLGNKSVGLFEAFSNSVKVNLKYKYITAQYYKNH